MSKIRFLKHDNPIIPKIIQIEYPKLSLALNVT